MIFIGLGLLWIAALAGDLLVFVLGVGIVIIGLLEAAEGSKRGGL